MAQRTVQTAPSWYRPPIPFVDPETGKKIQLHLRRMDFRREVDVLPADFKELQELMLKYRGRENEDRYMLVLVWNKLKKSDRYWQVFKFNSEAEYLAYYDLPDGTTLGMWSLMVELFDKPTFCLLGDQVLSFMIRLVGEYQTDTDERKKDYRAIFDRYCEHYDAFDKSSFYDLIRRYVEEKYVIPQAKAAGMSWKEWHRKRQDERVKTRSTKRRTTREAPKDQKVDPKIGRDFDWRTEQCSSCVLKIEIIAAFQEYTSQLEELIRERLGEGVLPKRPKILMNL